MMSNIELVLSFILLTLMHIKSHCGHIILRNIHFVWSFFVLGWKLLTNMRSIQSLSVCSLILCEWRASEICLIHLHWMLPILTHHVHGGASTTVIWCCSSIWHSTYKALTLQAHTNCHISSHLVHLLKIDPVHGLQWVHLLIDHVIYTNLWFSSRLLRGHWQVIRLVHCVLVLRLLCIQHIIVFLVRILHNFVHLNLIANARRRIWVLKVMNSLLICILLMNVILWASRRLAAWIWVNAADSLSWSMNGLPRRTESITNWSLWLRTSWFSSILFGDIYGTSTMTSLADSTTFGYLHICSCFIGF